MDEEQRRDALLEAVRELVPAHEPPARPVPPPRNGRAAFALAAGWVFLGYIWIAKPAWIFGPRADTVLATDRRDAALRFTLYLQRARLDEYADDHGGPPTTLEATGPVEDGVTWQPNGTGYVLTGELQGQTLRLSDAMDADSFLGRSLEVLRR